MLFRTVLGRGILQVVAVTSSFRLAGSWSASSSSSAVGTVSSKSGLDDSEAEECLANSVDVQELEPEPEEARHTLIQVAQAVVTRKLAARQDDAVADAAWCGLLLRGLAPVAPKRLLGTCQDVFSDASACGEVAALLSVSDPSPAQESLAVEAACRVLAATAAKGRRPENDKSDLALLARRGASQVGTRQVPGARTVRGLVEETMRSKGRREIPIAGPPYPNLTCANLTLVTNEDTGVENVSVPEPDTTVEAGCWIYEDAQNTTTSTTTTTEAPAAGNASSNASSPEGGDSPPEGEDSPPAAEAPAPAP
jgi:hypothetical protein